MSFYHKRKCNIFLGQTKKEVWYLLWDRWSIIILVFFNWNFQEYKSWFVCWWTMGASSFKSLFILFFFCKILYPLVKALYSKIHDIFMPTMFIFIVTYSIIFCSIRCSLFLKISRLHRWSFFSNLPCPPQELVSQVCTSTGFDIYIDE